VHVKPVACRPILHQPPRLTNGELAPPGGYAAEAATSASNTVHSRNAVTASVYTQAAGTQRLSVVFGGQVEESGSLFQDVHSIG